MDQNTINEAYKKFKIPENMIPKFSDAKEFSKNFKKCSILKDVATIYSDSADVKHEQ